MSDQSAPIAAPSVPVSAPSAPAPAPSAHEVPINPNPVDSPTPIGSQAPPRRQEIIAKAFERARVERKGAAEAKMGHNQPPEATEAEKPAKAPPPPLDLKKRPADQEQAQPQAAQPAQQRGERGRFAGRPEGQPGQVKPPPAPLPENAPYREPLGRMSDHARNEWASVPESVRGEVHRMHREFSEAYQRSRADSEVMQSLRPYHDLAKSQGTSLRQALTNYVGIEHKLRQDPIGGLETIVNNLNLRTQDGHRLGLHDIAAYVLQRSPEQHQIAQSQNQQTATAHQLNQIRQAQQALARQQQRMQYEHQFRRTRGAVNRFADTHPRLDELSGDIERELSFGFDLPTAYRRAEMLRPTRGSPPAAQTRTPAAQTRATDRSISGAPDGGASALNGASRPRVKTDRRGSIENAFRRASGSL